MRTNWLCFLCVLLSLAAGDAAEPAARDGDTPQSPEQSLRCLRTRQGLRIELVAAEPLVADPIAIAWGPDGKLWVVEMGDYPLGDDGANGGRIRFLTDTDDDGRYDQSTVFLDGLSFPTGVTPWRDGVLVTCAPEIFYAEDTNRDGKADKRETLYHGFNRGNPQHTVNGPRWGLDNWIHVANGDSDGVIELTRTGQRKDIFGHDFRIRPATGELELETGRSQFGRCRDDWGNWFGGNNTLPLWHCVIEDRYLSRNPRWSPPDPAVDLTPIYPPVSPISRPQPRLNEFAWPNRITSACGSCVYRDELVARPGHVFICEPAHNLVHQRVLHRNQSTFTSRAHDSEQEFLASTDNWFRPTQVRTGPDGALWVVDMYRLVIEHPQYFEQPADGEIEFPSEPSLRMGSNQGRIYRVLSTERPPRRPRPLSSATALELVDALDSPNGPQRDMAQQLLVERRAVEAAPAIGRLFHRSPHANRRLQALATLEGLGVIDDSLLASALSDSHGAVRRHAVWIAESRLQRDEVRRALLKMAVAGDPDAQVRLQLACSLGEWRDPQAGAALAGMMIRDADDPYIVASVMSAVQTHVQWILPELIRQGADLSAHRQLAKELIPAVLDAEDENVLSATLHELVKRADKAGRIWQWEVLARLLHALDHQGSSLSELQAASGAKLAAAIESLSPLFDAARQAAFDEDGDTQERTLAVGLMGHSPDGPEADIQRLRELLTPITPVEVQLAIVRRLANTSGPDVPGWLLSDFARRGPRVRTEILDKLLDRKEWAAALLDALESGRLAPADVGPVHRDRLVLHYYASVRHRAAKLLDQPTASRQAIVANYLPATQMAGDARRGEALFGKHCAACHRANQQGLRIGPDLKEIVGRTGKMLLIDILDPNRRVDPKFLSYSAVTDAGRIHTGIVAREAGASLRIISSNGEAHDLLRNELADLTSGGLSLMPEGLEQLLPELQDLADLLAFLKSG